MFKTFIFSSILTTFLCADTITLNILNKDTNKTQQIVKTPNFIIYEIENNDELIIENSKCKYKAIKFQEEFTSCVNTIQENELNKVKYYIYIRPYLENKDDTKYKDKIIINGYNLQENTNTYLDENQTLTFETKKFQFDIKVTK